MQEKIKKAMKPLVERFPTLATTYRSWRDRRQMNRAPAMTPFGFLMVGNPAMQAGKFEPQETKLFLELAAQADIVIDAGANIGYYCLHAAKIGKPVIAFEPIAINLHYLLKNVAANGFEGKIEVLPLALSSKVGMVTMYGEGTGASVHRGWQGIATKIETLIPATTLDHLLGARILGKKTFILIDVEGGEHELLQGAHSLLAANPKPVWMIEIASAWMPTFEIFKKYGYRAYGIENGALAPLDEQRIASIAGGKTRMESHNFVFVHESSPQPRNS